MAVDNVNHLDIEADEEEQADGHIITTTTTSPSSASASASASLSSLNDQHHDDHDAWPSSAEKQLTPPSTPTSSKYEENDDDASDDLKYDDSSSTKEAAAQLLVSTSADDGTKNSNAIDNISPSKPEVISDVGPPIPYANINAEKKHVTTVGIEQTDENYGPEPPAYMIAPTLADDHFAKKRGLICWNTPQWLHQDCPITSATDRHYGRAPRTYRPCTEPPICHSPGTSESTGAQHHPIATNYSSVNR